jgi:hypothetical protein
MIRRTLNSLVKRGVETAVQVTAESAATATTKAYLRIFEVTLPTTIYVRASQSNITVRRKSGTQVQVSASLRASFGWELVAEQDDAGIYVVAKRKLLVGSLSTASFTLVVPPEANLIFHLTPGTVRLYDIDGKLTIPGSPLSLVPAEK